MGAVMRILKPSAAAGKNGWPFARRALAWERRRPERQISKGRWGKMRVKWKGKTSFLMLTNDKTYEVIGIERGWYRLIDDSGEDYLYPPEPFEIIKE